jgi:WavE lipopolysaccharide synthesis.
LKNKNIRRMMEEITYDNLSIVIEGPVIEHITSASIKSLKKCFPYAEIILSVWEDAKVDNLDYSILVRNEYPKDLIKTNHNWFENINGELLLIKNGLKKATRKFCLKFRTDLLLNSSDFLKYFDSFPERNEQYKLFDHRILVPSNYSNSFSSNILHPVLFYPSHSWLFGYTSDLKIYFDDTPLVDEDFFDYRFKYPKKNIIQSNKNRFLCDQYYCFSAFKRYFKNLEFDDCSDWNSVNFEQSEIALSNNYIFLNFEHHGIRSMIDSDLSTSKATYQLRELGVWDYDLFTYNYRKYCDKNYIRGIVVTSDFLRIGNNYNPYYFKSTTEWIYNLFNYQIKLATNLEPILVTGESHSLIDRDYLYELNNLPLSEESWITLSDKEEWTKQAILYIKRRFSGYILIIHHANFAFLEILNELNITYIDLFESSFRFAEDLIFSFKTNNLEISKAIRQYTLPKSDLYILANYMKAYYNRRNSIEIIPNSILYVGQTSMDSSLIKDGKIVCLEDYQDTLSDIFSNYECIYYKPHPFSNNNKHEIEILERYGKLIVINENIYNLMSNQNISAISGLSSGVLSEAEFFDKKVYYISHKYIDYCDGNDDFESSKFILVNNKYFSPVFWQNILNSIFKNTNEISDFSFNNSNILRASLNCYWGYNLKFFDINELDIISQSNNDSSKLSSSQQGLNIRTYGDLFKLVENQRDLDSKYTVVYDLYQKLKVDLLNVTSKMEKLRKKRSFLRKLKEFFCRKIKK